MLDGKPSGGNRRRFLKGAGVATVAGLAGCTTETDSDPTDTEADSGGGGGGDESGTTVGDSGMLDVTLLARHFPTPGVEEFYEDHAASFQEDTGIELEIQTVGWGEAKQKQTNSIASQSGPVVEEIASTWMPEQVRADGWMDLNEAGVELDQSGIFGDPWDVGEFDGVRAGFPWFWGPKAHITHKPLVESAGIDGAPENWDELLEHGETFRQEYDDKHLFATPGANNWAVSHFFAMYLWQAGGSLLNTDNTKAAFNSEQGVRALNFYKDLAMKHDVAPKAAAEWNGPDRDSAFLNQRIASTWSSLVNVDNVVNETDADYDDVDVARPPAGPGGKSATFYGVNLMGIHPWAEGEELEAAVQWIEYLTQPEVNADISSRVGFLPTVKEGFDQEQFKAGHYQTMVDDVLPAASTFPPAVGWGQVEGALVDAVVEVLTAAVSGSWSEGDTQDALDTAAQQANEALD